MHILCMSSLIAVCVNTNTDTIRNPPIRRWMCGDMIDITRDSNDVVTWIGLPVSDLLSGITFISYWLHHELIISYDITAHGSRSNWRQDCILCLSLEVMWEWHLPMREGVTNVTPSLIGGDHSHVTFYLWAQVGAITPVAQSHLISLRMMLRISVLITNLTIMITL